MPLPSPILDDRSYQQLRDELVRRIPVYAPEWTDHNASDPGVTLIELFAFLGENLLYRFNQIPEASKLAYLKLLQIPLRPAVPARAMLSLTTELPGGVLVPQRSEARAGNLPFETQTEVQAWPISVLAVARARASAPDPDTEPEVYEFAVRTVDALRPLPAGQAPEYYENRVVATDGSGMPVDFGAAVDRMLWVAVLQEKGYQPDTLGSGLLNIGFVPDPLVATMDEVQACPGAGAGTRGPAVEWQVSAKAIANGVPSYRRLQVAGDTTRGLSQEGVVRLRLPRDMKDIGVPEAATDLGGTGDLPPVLDDETQAKVLFWLRAWRPDLSSLPRVALVTANAAESLQCATARPEFLGTGTGQAGQTCPLVHGQVLPGTLVLQVEEASGWVTWSEVDAFHASAPDSRHYVLDAEAGSVRFGNGEQGRAPQIGERIRAVSYRYGGGIAGNVAAKAISKVPVPGAKVVNYLRAWGGEDKEPLESALDRIPGELRRRDRAVTAGDFRELALLTPGASVSRAECLPRFHPPTRTPERAGIVSVVVWPKEDAKHPNAPLPDANLLRTVCAWLDERRLVTTELYVIPPTYRKVAVSVALQVKPGYGVEAVRRWVEIVLRQYLAPLPPYGPSGQGWPLGRRVYGPELEAAALQVEGVEFLEQLDLAGRNAADDAWVPGAVELAPYEVPELTEIIVVEGATAPPAGEAPAPPADTVPVPVPLLREEC
jgi:Baseplate J-like protein